MYLISRNSLADRFCCSLISHPNTWTGGPRFSSSVGYLFLHEHAESRYGVTTVVIVPFRARTNHIIAFWVI